ncbi:MAG: hypothetical protein GY713_15220 [Actinomycetia bacterium]|nr:hypothetical protein [Actinomycetes bacterium]
MRAAAAISALAGVFAAGWLISPDPTSPTNESLEFGIDTTPSIPYTRSAPHASPNDAAIAAALAQNPGLDEPRVTRMVTVFADDTMVDLRVEVQDDGFCHWYGVLGTIHHARSGKELRGDLRTALAAYDSQTTLVHRPDRRVGRLAPHTVRLSSPGSGATPRAGV